MEPVKNESFYGQKVGLTPPTFVNGNSVGSPPSRPRDFHSWVEMRRTLCILCVLCVFVVSVYRDCSPQSHRGHGGHRETRLESDQDPWSKELGKQIAINITS